MTAPTAVADPPRPDIALDHLSWSALKTYSECPAKFRFRYVDDAPEEFVGASLAFGGAFHHAVESINQARLEGASLPAINDLVERFKSHWDEEAAAGPAIRHCKGENGASIVDLASRMIASYHAFATLEDELPDRPNVLGIEHAARFRLLADAPPIEMRLDLLELDGDELIVTELKTSRCSWNDQKVRESVPQLILYAHGLMPMVRSIGAKKITLKFVVVTKGKSPKIQVLEPVVEPTDAARLKERVGESWHGIQSGIFPRHESWQCSQCPFRQRCLG